jgi:glycosyltransferase involved in cell wall biosynthesis
MQGVKGHLWEQLVLPRIAGDGFLWSPANSGPLTVTRQVLTIHDVASLDHPEWYSKPFALWYRWLTSKLVHRVRRVITVSEFSKQRLIALSGIEESRVVVIPPGVNRYFYRRPTREIEQVRRSLRIPAARYVLSLGVREPRKNLHHLLVAWASCVSDLPDDVWLVIAGAGGSRRVFSDYRLGFVPSRVHFTGFVPDGDLPALYSGAVALVYVSLYEGFGLPALEAMACGTVPIVSDNAAIPEVVGSAGLLVSPSDKEAIAAGIKRIVREGGLRCKLQVAGVRRSAKFSWERSADLTWKIVKGEALGYEAPADSADRDARMINTAGVESNL